MRTGFDDLPMIHDMDAVEIPNRCESVRHDDARIVGVEQRRHDMSLGIVVQSTGGFVHK